MTRTTLLHGDCLDVLKTLPDNSVDSIVTDPPYGLSFMGKRWDYDVPSVDVWSECLRVLKPGGHLLAFAGTRTQHRMAVRIEDAGFEIRDMVAWVYGSGFPKSLDVSKALDKANGKHERDLQPFGDYVKACRMAKGWSLRQLDEAMGTNTAASWWEGRKSGVQPPGLVQYQKLKGVLGMDDRFDELIDWLEAEREVVGKAKGAQSESTGRYGAWGNDNGMGSSEYDITAPATDAARQWQGWGTALKPALEPITVARKPLIGTVAENVLAHGTGALNIDGCRVGSETRYNAPAGNKAGGNSLNMSETGMPQDADGRSVNGRWPANLIHDGSEEVLAGFPVTTSGKMAPTHTSASRSIYGQNAAGGFTTMETYGDTGSAARFFYCAKASKKDRDEGLEGFADQTREGQYRSIQDGRPHMAKGYEYNREPRKNHHPTVKPTDLMRYLCRMVTQPGGVVLDPFMGSGSTGKAAALEGFQFIGIEREAEYLSIAEARIETAVVRNKPTDAVAPLQKLDLFSQNDCTYASFAEQ